MKKSNLYFGMLAMTGMLMATSCTQDELVNESALGDYVTASFNLTTADGLGTRAIGDGGTVDKVVCGVFDSKGVEMRNLRQTLDIVEKKAQYSIRLAKGQDYRVAFFAYDEDANAYNVEDMKNITLKDGQLSNVEGRDAFTAYFDIEEGVTMQPIVQDITLYRPFAQLNLGSHMDDWDAAVKAGVTVSTTKVIVSNVYTTFSAYDDAVVGETSERTFNLNTIPVETLKADADGDGQDEEYKYLAMNYLLVGDKQNEKSLTDVTFVWATEDGKTNDPITEFSNIPVQRNFRTNIIGWLLTNPAEFNITIEEQFDGEYNPTDILKNVLENGGELTLFSDLTLSEEITIPANKNVHLILNGNTLNVQNTCIVEGNLNISNGKINVDESGIALGFVADNGSAIQFDNVDVHVGQGDAIVSIYNETAYSDIETQIDVFNSTIDAQNGYGIWSTFGAKSVEINLVNSQLTGRYPIFLRDVEESVIDIDENSSVSKIAIDGKRNVSIIYAGEKPTVTDETNVTFYTKAAIDFSQALEDVENGGTVTLEDNIEIVDSLVIPAGKKVTINLGDKKITSTTGDGIKVNAGATLTISGNGTVESNGAPIRAIGGKVIVEGGTFTQTGAFNTTTPTYRYSIDSREGGEVIIKGGTFNTNNGLISVSAGSSVVIDGGNFTFDNNTKGTRHFAYVSGDLTVNDGVFRGVADSGAGGCFFCGAASTCKIEVNGGKFTSLWTSGSVNRIFESYASGSSINVTGGLFNTNGGIASFVEANTDAATMAEYPYKAK